MVDGVPISNLYRGLPKYSSTCSQDRVDPLLHQAPYHRPLKITPGLHANQMHLWVPRHSSPDDPNSCNPSGLAGNVIGRWKGRRQGNPKVKQKAYQPRCRRYLTQPERMATLNIEPFLPKRSPVEQSFVSFPPLPFVFCCRTTGRCLTCPTSHRLVSKPRVDYLPVLPHLFSFSSRPDEI